jgi:hypothetical protein
VGQPHNVVLDAVAPVLTEFFAGGATPPTGI